MEPLLVLLDRLEALIRRSGNLPLTGRKMVDQDDALALIRAIRDRLPREMAEGARMRDEAEAILRRAQDEARAVLQEAERRVQALVAEHAVSRQADARAQQALAQARAEADATRRGADAYAVEALERLEAQARRILDEIQRGKAVLAGEEGGARERQAG